MTMTMHSASVAECSPRFGQIPAAGHDSFAQPLSDGAFVALRAAYRSTGGIARGDEIAAWANQKGQGDFLSLNRAIVAGELFSFSWNNTFWLPMFQFDLHDLSVRRDLLPLIWELQNDCDGWALATWFARAHADLGGQAPVELLDTELAAVLVAARAGRQVETG